MALARCVTEIAYEMRRAVQGIYEWKDVGGAIKLFGNGSAWWQAMWENTGYLFEPLARAAELIERRLEGILAKTDSSADGGLHGGAQHTVRDRKAK
jgi:hypothetical protein